VEIHGLDKFPRQNPQITPRVSAYNQIIKTLSVRQNLDLCVFDAATGKMITCWDANHKISSNGKLVGIVRCFEASTKNIQFVVAREVAMKLARLAKKYFDDAPTIQSALIYEFRSALNSGVFWYCHIKMRV
jgi:hypothetical protein